MRRPWRLILCFAATVGLLGGAVLINGYCTQRYARIHDAWADMMATTLFLAEYAKAHSGNLPNSWEELAQQGLIAPDPKGGVQFCSYTIGTRVCDCRRVRWIPGANLWEYALAANGLVRRKDGVSTRLLWIDGLEGKTYNEAQFNAHLLELWEAREPTSRP